MLVIALAHEVDRAHQRRVCLSDSVLHIHREGEVLPPVGVFKPALIRADEEHYLACAHALFLGHGLVHHAVRAQRVTVDIEHYTYARVAFEVLCNGRARTVI